MFLYSKITHFDSSKVMLEFSIVDNLGLLDY